MSIVDSSTDLAEAKARLATVASQQLLDDLAYWSQAVLDAGEEYRRLSDRQDVVTAQYSEAQRWVTLVATELRTRRDARRDRQAPDSEEET